MPEPERDAFGQPIGQSTVSVPTAVEPEPAPAAIGPAGSDEPFGPPRRRGRVRRSLFLLACLAGTAVVLWQADRAALDSPAVIGRDLDGRALHEVSLVREANFRRALRTVRAELRPGEQVLSLRVEPGLLMIRARDENGNARVISTDVAFDVDTDESGTDTSSEPLDLAALDVAAPERIARLALRQSDADDGHLESLSIDGPSQGTQPTWFVSLEDVRIADQSWTSDVRGVAVTHPGELPPASGVDAPSLLAPGPLERALEQVAEHGRTVTSLRVEPQRLDVTVATRRGLVDVSVDAAQRVTAQETTGSASDSIPLRRIDPAAPRRAVLAAAREGGFPAARIDYGVLWVTTPSFGAGNGWILFFENVPQARSTWRSGLDGTGVTSG
ncbi:MAG TPA: hypothetical protein VIL49_07265 [Capillimicrobium sp.]